MKWFIAFFLVLVLAIPTFAVLPDEVLKDPVLEARARTISTQLRCLVCQNQNIDESNASLARDLRLLVRERLVMGDSDKQVINFLVARYGEFILLNPRFSLHTVILWFATPIVLLLALWVVIAALGRRKRELAAAGKPPTSLTKEESDILATLDDPAP